VSRFCETLGVDTTSEGKKRLDTNLSMKIRSDSEKGERNMLPEKSLHSDFSPEKGLTDPFVKGPQEVASQKKREK